MSTVTLNAETRTEAGKGHARKSRRAGKIPAVVYRGGDSSTAITIDPKALEFSFLKTQNRNTLVSIELDGETKLCLVKEAQRHPVTRRLQHVDFYQVRDDEKVTVKVPVRTTGKVTGGSGLGVLRVIRRDVTVSCLPKDIPEALMVDVSNLSIGDFWKVSAIPAPEGAELLYKNDYAVLACVGKRIVVEEEPEEEAADGEEGEAGAGEGAEG